MRVSQRVVLTCCVLAAVVRGDVVDVESCDMGTGRAASLMQSPGALLDMMILDTFREQPAMGDTKEWVPSADGRVHVRALVESFCPASKYFLKRQFIPLMKDPEVRKLLDIDIVFFTNALVDSAGKVTCQHGQGECETNRKVMCAKTELSSDVFVTFMECALPQIDQQADDFVTSCLSDELSQTITDCARGEKGLMLQNDALMSFPEDRQYSPWVLMEDGRSSTFIHSTRAEQSLLEVMCQSVSDKLAACPPLALAASVFTRPSIRPSARFWRSSLAQRLSTDQGEVATSQAEPHGNNTLLKLRVFFDGLCPASQAFISNQVVPFMQSGDFDGLLDVELLPFANAVVGQSGDLVCQHGEHECQANLRIVCARKQLEMRSFIDFMGCIEPIPDSEEAIAKVRECLKHPEVAAAVETCASSSEARSLRFAAFESAPPDHKYCPWVTVNDEHSEAGEYKLKETVCKLLPVDKQPATCKLM